MAKVSKKGTKQGTIPWQWWKEKKMKDGVLWNTLRHNGPLLPPPYKRVPRSVKFYYSGNQMKLSKKAEEVAGLYAMMLGYSCASRPRFKNNFFKDWTEVMTSREKEIIEDFNECDFTDFEEYYKQKARERKTMTREKKLEMKRENEKLTKKYGYCILDDHKQEVVNFKIEPPALFKGRGNHPKMGMLKKRVEAEDVVINIGRRVSLPRPPRGHRWKEVCHDNKVAWLAKWAILGSTKYMMLGAGSKLKGVKDKLKYENARKLKTRINSIRRRYKRGFRSRNMLVRQRAVALYFIDQLSLRAGNEKGRDTADTVGCCSLRVQHITLDAEKDGKRWVVSFDFPGKDSIRYRNSMPVDRLVFRNLENFMRDKRPRERLFDRLSTSILNQYLNHLYRGLTAKVFRTYNASTKLEKYLDLLTRNNMNLDEKIRAYHQANKEVAIMCNHRRAIPRGFVKSMENLNSKISDKITQIKEMKREVTAARKSTKKEHEDKKRRLSRLEEQLTKLKQQARDKEGNKHIALGTSRLNYLDPRISIAWCKKWDVPIDRIFNPNERSKFEWAETAVPSFKY
ncbi:DNA topoisomerase 1 [Caerostris darwini]|uniref:DNA topoisomerase 1 n=1 Tax=Caerostris darwini TaxID=1538125 RepID=A0AAV4SPW0_9ARAC|nr:DNA topoisomerase 1 [Caerostris darwini]